MSWYLKYLSPFQKFQASCGILAVLGILAAILFPVFGQAHECSRHTSCSDKLHHLSAAALQYAQDYDGYYPGSDGPGIPLLDGRPLFAAALTQDDRARDWPAQTLPYIQKSGYYYCPQEPFCGGCGMLVTPGAETKYAASYTLNGWTAFGLREGNVNNPGRFLLFAERNTAALEPDASYLFAWWKWQRAKNNFVWPPTANPIPAEQGARDFALTRHQEVANYVFADGHVKAMRFGEAWNSAKPTAFWPESE